MTVSPAGVDSNPDEEDFVRKVVEMSTQGVSHMHRSTLHNERAQRNQSHSVPLRVWTQTEASCGSNPFHLDGQRQAVQGQLERLVKTDPKFVIVGPKHNDNVFDPA